MIFTWDTNFENSIIFGHAHIRGLHSIMFVSQILSFFCYFLTFSGSIQDNIFFLCQEY